MKTFVVSLVVVFLLISGCDAATSLRSAEVDSASPTPLYDKARHVHLSEGIEAAVGYYERAAEAAVDGGSGVASVFLWNYYGSRGDEDRASAHRDAALRVLGDKAWVIWAGQVQPDTPGDVIPYIERLERAAALGSSSAAASLEQVFSILNDQASNGNAAAAATLKTIAQREAD